MANSHIPGYLVMDILVRLPVKSLMRFRCVHRSWSCLFQNPNFIAQQHLFHQTQTDSCLLVNRKHHVTDNNVLSFVPPDDYDFNCGAFDMSQSLSLDLHFFKEDLQDLVIGPCINGIICLIDFPRDFVRGKLENNVDPTRIALWNPALREFKILPKNPINCRSTEDYVVDALGFGHDPKSNDYKVVRIVSFCPVSMMVFYDDMILDGCPSSSLPPYEVYSSPTLYEVYSLSTNSWRKIDTDFRGFVARDGHGIAGEIYLNGAYYWWGITGERDPDFSEIQAIVSFNMSNEVFQIIRLPDLSHRRTIWKTLTELNNSIALVVHQMDGIEKNFDIWVMREYGVKESWTKQFTIGPISGVERSLGFGKNDQLFLVGQNGEVVLCNTSGQKIKNVQVKDFLDSLEILHGVIYMESLVSIRAGNMIQN